jgi:hypothetical protein
MISMNVFFLFSRYYYDFRIHHSTMRVYIAAENGTCIKTIASQFLFLVRTRHHFVADQLTHNEQRWVAISVFVLFFPFSLPIYCFSNWAHCVCSNVPWLKCLLFLFYFLLLFFWQVTINRKPDGPQFPGNKFAFNLNPIKKKKIFDLELIEISYR